MADGNGEGSPPALRVPEITVYFWIAKGLSTAIGESSSDFLVHELHPVPAVLFGFAGFGVALALQFSMRRSVAWTYWLAVVMVGIFGTMAADVLHVGLHVPYVASTACTQSCSSQCSSSGSGRRRHPRFTASTRPDASSSTGPRR